MKINASLYQSPAGELCVGEYDGKICLCDWTAGTGRPRQGVLSRLLKIKGCSGLEISKVPATDLVKEAFRQLDLYFNGSLKAFDLPLLFAGTPFQRHIWNLLLRIPYGTTVSYSDLCNESPTSVRAVANAVGANPMSIIVPCHRVCRKNSSGTRHTGYAGGLPAKILLLELEA